MIKFREFAEARNGAWPWHEGCGVAEAHHLLAETMADWCDYQEDCRMAGGVLAADEWLRARKQ